MQLPARTAASLVTVLVIAVCALCALCACQTEKQPAPLPLPPKGTTEYPEYPQPKEEEKPAVPEACKHTWEADKFGMHQFTVDEDGVPVVKLCTPIVCTKCGAVRHECMKELGRRRR